MTYPPFGGLYFLGGAGASELRQPLSSGCMATPAGCTSRLRLEQRAAARPKSLLPGWSRTRRSKGSSVR